LDGMPDEVFLVFMQAVRDLLKRKDGCGVIFVETVYLFIKLKKKKEVSKKIFSFFVFICCRHALKSGRHIDYIH
jgi:hypothetical protein